MVQALGAAKGNDLPILIVVCNNRQYRAMQVGHRHHYPDGVAQEADIWHGVAIDGHDFARARDLLSGAPVWPTESAFRAFHDEILKQIPA